MNTAQKSAAAIKKIATQAVAEWVPTPVRGVVTALDQSGARAFLKRAGEEVADPISHPVFSGGYKPAVGDWVWGFDMTGGFVILGRTRNATDPDVDSLADQNGNQALILGNHDDRITAEAVQNAGQKSTLDTHNDRLSDLGARISALENQNANQADVLVAHSDRLSTLDTFRTRAAGFAAETHYHVQYLTQAEGDARYVRKT